MMKFKKFESLIKHHIVEKDQSSQINYFLVNPSNMDVAMTSQLMKGLKKVKVSQTKRFAKSAENFMNN